MIDFISNIMIEVPLFLLAFMTPIGASTAFTIIFATFCTLVFVVVPIYYHVKNPDWISPLSFVLGMIFVIIVLLPAAIVTITNFDSMFRNCVYEKQDVTTHLGHKVTIIHENCRTRDSLDDQFGKFEYVYSYIEDQNQ